MKLSQYFRSVIDEDQCAVVICNLDHLIVYMNPAARERYAERGGASLIGRNLLNCHAPESAARIQEVVDWFSKSKNNNRVYTFYNEEENMDAYMVALRDTDGTLIGYYEKHEYRSRETKNFYEF